VKQKEDGGALACYTLKFHFSLEPPDTQYKSNLTTAARSINTAGVEQGQAIFAPVLYSLTQSSKMASIKNDQPSNL